MSCGKYLSIETLKKIDNDQHLSEPKDNEKEKNKININVWVYIIVTIVLCLVITCVPYYFTQCWILGCA